MRPGSPTGRLAAPGQGAERSSIVLTALAIAITSSACAPAPPLDLPPRSFGSAAAAPSDPGLVPESVAWEAARRKAYGPRRFKALFRGEISPQTGAILRGYLATFWDGQTLTFKTSAPVAGEGRSGSIHLRAEPGSGPEPDGTLLPGASSSVDAIGALLGVLDLPATGGGAGQVQLPGGRSASLDAAGRVIALVLPGNLRVAFEPGEGVPRRISGVGPQGRVSLTLESYGPWAAGEPVP